jgi:FkbM family methyltransferase
MRIIQANASRNKCVLETVNAALAYGCDSVTFWVNSERPYSSALTEIHSGCKQITVPAITLRTLFEVHSILKCTLLCDIEGQEYELVKNELPLISKRVSNIIMETHPQLIGHAKTTEMLAALASVGFETCDIIRDVYVLTRS